jgi:hypothetical protein
VRQSTCQCAQTYTKPLAPYRIDGHDAGRSGEGEPRLLRIVFRLEPVATVDYPPCGENDGDGGGASPLEWKQEIG